MYSRFVRKNRTNEFLGFFLSTIGPEQSSASEIYSLIGLPSSSIALCSAGPADYNDKA